MKLVAKAAACGITVALIANAGTAAPTHTRYGPTSRATDYAAQTTSSINLTEDELKVCFTYLQIDSQLESPAISQVCAIACTRRSVRQLWRAAFGNLPTTSRIEYIRDREQTDRMRSPLIAVSSAR